MGLFVATLPRVPDARASLTELRTFYAALVDALALGLVAMQARTEAVLGPALPPAALSGEAWLASQDVGWLDP